MSNTPPFFNVHNNHQLISNTQDYVLDRKLLTVHTEDRDIKKWPKANHFEIILPEALRNVQSMRLVQIMLPANYYSFSNDFQNTKLSFDASLWTDRNYRNSRGILLT